MLSGKKQFMCRWDTQWDKQGSTGRCPQGFPVVCFGKLTEKGNLIPSGCPRDTRPPTGFQKLSVIFFFVPFLLAILKIIPRLTYFRMN